MTHQKLLLRAAISTALAVTGAMSVTNALAADGAKEQCAGVVKAGKNDCVTKTNACHGHVTQDAMPDAWIYLPKGTCERIVGAHLVMVAEPAPKK
jgi:uncharacterized membrane protein